MSPLDKAEIVPVVITQAIKDNTEFVGSDGSTPVTVDTLGYDRLDMIVQIGATDIAMVEMELYASDVAGSGFALVPEYEFGGTGLPALPLSTDDNKVYRMSVDLREHSKRYWRIGLIPGDGAAGTFATATAFLFRADESPNTAAARGYGAEILPS